jgi:hypothetical protein
LGIRGSLAAVRSGRSTRELCRTAQLGDPGGFATQRKAFERTRDLARHFLALDLTDLPNGFVRKAVTYSGRLLESLKAVMAYTGAEPQKAAIVEAFENEEGTFYSHFSQALGISLVRGSGIQEIIARLQAESKKHEELLGNLETEKVAIAELAGTVAVANYAKFFHDEARAHTVASRWWLGATAAIGAGMASFALYLLVTGTEMISAAVASARVPEISTGTLVHQTLAKALLFSVLYFALVSCVRVYRAHRHNVVVNRHRENALSSFRAFVIAAGDDLQTRNAVLLQATQTIFQPQSTGFATGETEPSPTQFIEVVKTIEGGGRGQRIS